ncbi:MAG TPA: head decoration protein [Galbitalea sp.]|nr:head decoration protein [Galbitalea sp.]
MSTDISMVTQTFQVGNRQWLLSEPDWKPNVTLDISLFSRNGTSEVQTVTISGTPTGGTFTLTFAGQTTAGIAYNAAASAVQTALAALSTVGAGNVAVTGSNGGPYTVTFGGILAHTNVAAMTVSVSSLTGGTPAGAVATGTGGVNAHYPDGFIPSGTVLGKVTSSGLFGPYDPSANDGRETAYGFSYGDARAVRWDGSVASLVGTGAVVNQAAVSLAHLPFQSGTGSIDTDGKADLPTIRFEA